MILLLTQIWGFLLIAWLLGMIVGGLMMWPRRSIRLKEVETDLRTARDRSVALDKEVTELRAKVGELEGIPEAERRSRVAAREELIARIARLETDVSVARNSELQAKDENETLRRENRNLSVQLNDERNKPAPVLELTPAQADTSAFDEEIATHKARADEAQRLAETKAAEAGALKSKLVDLEGRVARALEGARDADVFKNRVLELEAQLRQEQMSASDRFSALSAKNADLEARLREQQNSARMPVLEVSELAGLRRDAEQMLVWKAKAGDLEQRLLALGDAREEASELRQRVSRLESELAASTRETGSIQDLRARAADLETRLSAEQSRAAGDLLKVKDDLNSARTEGEILAARLADAEAKLEPFRAAASESASLRTRLAETEARLASVERGYEDPAPLKARIVELEARARELDLAAKSAAQTSAETGPLRARIADLERRLVDAQRAQDEAAILRAQVAEMDGRLGQALRQAADAEALRARLAALEAKPA